MLLKNTDGGTRKQLGTNHPRLEFFKHEKIT
jgi:hypothetical protein